MSNRSNNCLEEKNLIPEKTPNAPLPLNCFEIIIKSIVNGCHYVFVKFHIDFISFSIHRHITYAVIISVETNKKQICKKKKKK